MLFSTFLFFAGDAVIHPTHSFAFDHVYDQNTPQKHIYDNSAKVAVLSTLKGYNATIIAYGQTGTGKTYTMEGNSTPEGRGIIPRSIEDIFYFIENDTTARSKYLVRASYLQIYNEVSIFQLLLLILIVAVQEKPIAVLFNETSCLRFAADRSKDQNSENDFTCFRAR